MNMSYLYKQSINGYELAKVTKAGVQAVVSCAKRLYGDECMLFCNDRTFGVYYFEHSLGRTYRIREYLVATGEWSRSMREVRKNKAASAIIFIYKQLKGEAS